MMNITIVESNGKQQSILLIAAQNKKITEIAVIGRIENDLKIGQDITSLVSNIHSHCFHMDIVESNGKHKAYDIKGGKVTMTYIIE